jgi:phosphoglycolate phosphatase
MISNLLIDLDGTLTDPKSGIIGSVQYALRTMGQEAPKASDLLWLIGPPLQGSFKILLDGSGLDVHEAIKIFRERFGSVGLFENAMYDGVPEFLAEQSSANKRLFIASTKPYVYISRILKHFEIRHFFEGVYGSELDGTLSIKSDLLRYIFSRQIFNTDEAVMIGDRIQDVEAAKSVGVCSIWVDYGYSDQSERDIAKPDYICNSINELRKLLNRI